MDNKKVKGYIYLGITILLFSTLEVVSITLKSIINPMQLTFFRFLIGGITLLPCVFIKKEKICFKDFLFFAELGLLNTVISMGSYQLAISMGKASTTAIIMSANPVFVVLFSSVILKEKITKDKILCVLLGILGIILIMYKGDSSEGNAMSSLLALIGSVTFALYTVLGKMKADNISSITMISLSAIFGSLFYIPILLYLKLPIFYLPMEGLIKILYLGIFVSGIAYITFMEALKILSASKGSMVFFLKPGIVAVLAAIFLGETVSFKTVLGMLLVISGILISFIYTNKTGRLSNKGINC